MRDAADTDDRAFANANAGAGSLPAVDCAGATAPAERGERRFDFTTALVLAAAGLASAWATFQGGLWDKRESEQYAVSNSHLTESSQLLIRSGQEQAVGAAMFLQWVDAKANRQDRRATLIENHMPPWFAGEFDAWRRRLPADLAAVEPNAQLPRFYGPSLEKAVVERTASDTARTEARQAGDNGDTYDIANVILAVALFLAGITAVLQSRSGKRMIMALAGTLTLFAIVSMLLAPRIIL